MNVDQSLFELWSSDPQHTALGFALYVGFLHGRFHSLSLAGRLGVFPKANWCTWVIKTLGTEPFTIGNGTERRV
jgi:hypothetical protein